MAAARLVNDLFASWATAVDCVLNEVDADGVRALWIDPVAADPERVLFYLHGGGYILGTADHVAKMVGHIARSAGCRALSVDYRLAPEHGYPAGLDDAVTAYTWLLDQRVRPGQVVVAGDSAGGGLCLAMLLTLRDRGLPLPAAAVPISPWAEITCSADAWVRNADTDFLLDKERLTGIGELYTQGADPGDPLVSPVHGDYAGLPPMYIQASAYETLLDDCLAVAGAAARGGVDVRLDVFPEMQHVFQYCAGNMPEADEAISRIGNWIRLQTGA